MLSQKAYFSLPAAEQASVDQGRAMTANATEHDALHGCDGARETSTGARRLQRRWTAAPSTETLPGTQPDRRRLGDVLLERDLLTREQLDEALAEQQKLVGKDRKRLGKLIVEMGFLTERQIAEALAELLALDLLDGGDLSVPMEVARLLPRQVAERARVLVLGRTIDGLRIATADPTNVVALDDVRAYTGSHTLSLVVATDSMIQEHIARIWSMGADAGAMLKITRRRGHRRAPRRGDAGESRRSSSDGEAAQRLAFGRRATWARATSTSSSNTTASGFGTASTACCATSPACPRVLRPHW